MCGLLETVSPLPENGIDPGENSYLSKHRERAIIGRGRDRLFLVMG
jgi:hypothetical protein